MLSKVHVPEKQVEEEPPLPPKGVPSVVKVKPRVLPPGTKQANKNLLLKAVAEAQRSVTQTPSVGNNLKVIKIVLFDIFVDVYFIFLARCTFYKKIQRKIRGAKKCFSRKTKTYTFKYYSTSAEE